MEEYKKELEDLQKRDEAPMWMTPAAYQTISKGYRLKGETPRGMYRRVTSLDVEVIPPWTTELQIKAFISNYKRKAAERGSEIIEM